MNRPFPSILALALLAASLAQADAVYTITMNTSALVGNGPFALDLQLVDGTGLPQDLNNNTMTLSDFQFGPGGSPSGGGIATGGASGSLAAGVTLADSSFFNEYVENFTPGPLLSFTLDTTNVLDPSGVPDLFTLAILDSMGNELPTNGFADEFLDVTLAGGASPLINAFGSAPGATYLVNAPIVQPQSAVPEPSVLVPLTVGLSLLLVRRHYYKS